MNKNEKQVVTKLNKKLEKYGLSKEELELKLHSASIYGDTVMKMASNFDACKTCRHCDKDKKVCDKKHHCDCDCPDCSPESYI